MYDLVARLEFGDEDLDQMLDSGEKEFCDSLIELQGLIKEVLKFEEPQESQFHEQEEFARMLYVLSSMLRHRVWIHKSHESQQIPFWLILTGFEHSLHGYFHDGGPGFR